jgi:hypothetical protein
MKSLKTSINLKDELLSSFTLFCKRYDLTPAQCLKFMVVNILSSRERGGATLGGISAHGQFSRTCEVNNNLSLDKSNSSDDAFKEFVKTFTDNCQNVKFPERISKEIKLNWDAILNSKLSASELADSYNDYLKESRLKDSIPCYPNSWISGHGWLNKSETLTDELRGNYEF